LMAAVITAVYTGVVTFLILKVVGAVVGLRVSETEEHEGVDTAYHGEEAYND
jgi:Amt family ammonium transporter